MINRFVKYILIAIISLTITLKSSLVIAQSSSMELEQQGRSFYQNFQYQQAINVWQQVFQDYQAKNDLISQARVLSNLALAYQQKGAWEQAEQAISQSLNLINQVRESPQKRAVFAQILNNKGLIEFARGQPEQALETWDKASQTYSKISDQIGYLRSQVNQAKALHFLGLHPRACQILSKALDVDQVCTTTDIEQTEKLLEEKFKLDNDLNLTVLAAWITLAQELGDLEFLELSNTILVNLLARVDSSEEKAIILFNLGKIANSQKDFQEALQWYQEAIEKTSDPQIKVLILLSQLDFFKATEQESAIPSLVRQIQSLLEQLPTTQDTVYAQVNFVNQIIFIKQKQPSLTLPSWLELAEISANALQQAKVLASPRIEAYALGNLASVYEQTKQLDTAQKLTEQAIILSQSLNTPEITYHWLWQLGRILQAQGNQEKAISIYSEAVNTLELIKRDLVAVNQDIQFSFASEVEPVYRELVSLLLQPDVNNEISQENLRKARDVIESLQLAELNNFLQENCLEAQPQSIEKIDQQAAVIYPIILNDRLEIILSLPQKPLKRYSRNVPKSQVIATAVKLRQTLVIRSRRDFYEPAQQLYQWLIDPLEQDLKNSQIKTLVFVLDGPLRNIPIGALYDGQKYLIEKYETSLTPGLQLLNPQPLQQTDLYTLAAGLTQARKGFSPLFYVAQELETIQENVRSRILINQDFTIQSFKKNLLDSSFPIVHIATHGQFSSSFQQTFLLAWDDKINVRQLQSLLKGRDINQDSAIELLVLSACETATGDERATLGLAGLAVRSGARSTVATLWSVNDEASAEFINAFYHSLAMEKKTKSQSLRDAKLALIKNPKYRHPFYWSPYILLGNWL